LSQGIIPLEIFHKNGICQSIDREKVPLGKFRRLTAERLRVKFERNAKSVGNYLNDLGK
jgi:hypothetical protein